MSWMQILMLVVWLIGKLPDSDKDGRPDFFDKFPKDPQKM